MKQTAAVFAFLVPLAASALQVGTNQVEFVLSDSGSTNGVREIILDEVFRLVAPSLPFCSCEDLGDGNGLFEGVAPSGTLDHPGLFDFGTWSNETLVVPVAGSFAAEVRSKIPFFDGVTNEMSRAESFRMDLVRAFSETNGIAFLSTNFVSKRFGTGPIPMAAATNIWMHWRSWISHPIPRTCFVLRGGGPSPESNLLWTYIPMRTNSSVFWLPIVFFDEKWKISMWDYEERGYGWE